MRERPGAWDVECIDTIWMEVGERLPVHFKSLNLGVRPNSMVLDGRLDGHKLECLEGTERAMSSGLASGWRKPSFAAPGLLRVAFTFFFDFLTFLKADLDTLGSISERLPRRSVLAAKESNLRGVIMTGNR